VFGTTKTERAENIDAEIDEAESDFMVLSTGRIP
jgi:hypothetical protein